MVLRAFQLVLYFLNWVSYVTTAIVLVVVVRRFVFWIQGISPVLRSLGNGSPETQNRSLCAERKPRGYPRSAFAIQTVQKGKHLRYRATGRHRQRKGR